MTPTVLLVDDDLRVLHALVRRLRTEPFQIRTATTAEEAWRSFERGPIDLVVCDWRMPAMCGTEFLVHVARKYPDCVRIMLTGELDPGVADGAIRNAQVYRFLTKPCPADLLAEVIREAFGRHAGPRTEEGHRPQAR